MKHDRPSSTAALVASLRSLAKMLPAAMQLAEDPYGFDFAGRAGACLRYVARRQPRALSKGLLLSRRALGEILWLQLRTRAIDDWVAQFVADGGRQVLLLGAGYDMRATRLAPQASQLVFYEVDHPATQAHKQRVLAQSQRSVPRARYVPFDFEARALSELQGELAALGHDARLPTLTIWEGVTMYLTRSAIEASLDCVRALSAVGSRLALTYFDRSVFEQPNLVRSYVRRVGEPLRFGWSAGELEPHLREHGFRLVENESIGTLARRLLPEHHASQRFTAFRHVALAEVSG